MLRRLGVGVVAIATLGLVTAGTAGAQGYGAPPGMGPGVGPGLSQGMGPMGPGMGPMGPGMGPMGQGTPGDIDLSMMPRSDWVPPMVRTHHPGDLGWPQPCPECRILVDPCEAFFQCESLPRAWWPESIGLHPTVTYATVQRYSPGGPLSCSFPRGATTIVCSTPGPDDPASWETRTGIDPQ